MEKEKLILSKQRRKYFLLMTIVITGIAGLLFLSLPREEKTVISRTKKEVFEPVSQSINPEDIRISTLESLGGLLDDRLKTLEKSILDLREENTLLATQKEGLFLKTQELNQEIDQIMYSHEREKKELFQALQKVKEPEGKLPTLSHLTTWSAEEGRDERHILFEIPAGTVVKAVLVSGADCSVAVQKPTGPNMVLLRPLDNGKLPRKVTVPLKGSVIIGNAIGDISSERVYIRAERMTLVQRSGDFVETDITAYISGEDGREGMRGVVVDRSGSIISRAAFASFLQGIGQGIEATLNNQTLEKLARTSSDETILNIDMVRTSALQGGTTALGKLAEYYIKRAEQLQPAIQIAAGRVVDVVFTKSVKIGEQDLKKKLAYEREVKNGKY